VKLKLLQEICPTQEIIRILNLIKAPVFWNDLEPAVSENSARFAFLNASLMRKRLTIGDLLIFTAWDREDLWNKIWKDHLSFVG